MQIATSTTRPAESAKTAKTHARASFFAWVLNGIVAADTRYRQKRALKDRSDAQLEDMGLTRRDADRAFSRRLAK